MRAFLFALEIEPMQVNKSYERLALHCTVLHWFHTHSSLEAIVKKAQPIINNTPPIKLVAGRPTLFGPSKGMRNIRVNLIEPNPVFRKLHNQLRNTIERLGAKHTEPYVGDNFQAHVTKQGSSRFIEGSEFTAKATYLIEALDPQELTHKHIHARLLHKA